MIVITPNMSKITHPTLYLKSSFLGLKNENTLTKNILITINKMIIIKMRSSSIYLELLFHIKLHFLSRKHNNSLFLLYKNGFLTD